jgi:long-chain fatty acid transport protein
VSIALCLSSTAYSGGFTVTVQSASSGGTASTNHAMAEDASAMFYNPALLSSMEGTQVNGGISLTSPDMTVTNMGSQNPSLTLGTPVVGSNTAEPTGLGATPSLYYKRDLSHKMSFGLGLNVPHGVSSEYEKDSFARYEATESALTALNINPALSFRVNDKLDLGAGINIQYVTATLAKSVDSRLLCSGIGAGTAAAAAAAQTGAAAQQATLTAVSGAASTICGNLAVGNAATDGSSTVEATGVGFGLNVGAAYRPNDATTISVGLRSAVKHELEGDVDFEHNAALTTALGTFGAATTTGTSDSLLAAAGYLDRDAAADLDLPATASLAFARKMNSKLTLHGDVTWTDWSSVPEIRIEFPGVTGSATLDNSVTDLQWEDTVRVGAGMTYQLSAKTKLRAGVAYDPTPTPGAQFRTPRAPSADTVWLSVGMGHDFSKKLSLDASLAYIHLEDMKIDYTSPSATTDYLTKANVEADAISAALSLNYRFK